MASSMFVEAFLLACGNFLRPDQIQASVAAQEQYGANTIAEPRSIAAALRPFDVAQIQRILALAREFEIALYPISTGHNWGYGGSVPHRENSVIVDLSAMNRILDFNPASGIVSVQPGVTIGQLHAYLQERKLPYMAPVTGAGPTNSLIGNALERGFGLTPHSDHFQAVKSIKALLADGRTYQSAFAEATAGHGSVAYKWGLGPYLDGLFSQGNLGIVIEAEIALAPLPDEVGIVLLGSAAAEPGEIVTYMQNMLRRYGPLLGGMQLINGRRFSSSSGADTSITPLAWNILVPVYGDPQIVRYTARQMKRYGRTIFTNRQFLPASTIARLQAWLAVLPQLFRDSRLGRKIALADELCAFVKGRPIDSVLRNFAYVAQGHAPPSTALNPDRDGCGLIWYAPLVPLDAGSVNRFLGMAKAVLGTYNYALSISLTATNPHYLDATLALQFDKQDPDSTERARDCYRALFIEGRRQGFLPYRLGLQGMDLALNEAQTFWQVARQIKQALDPGGVIAPGRYNTAA
jgi:4-cresol dehydrogenase (hydroxylating) flavoprotein subunit